MSALWSKADAAEATGGKVVGEWEVSGLSIDTRTIEPGDMFVALKDQRDGHDFIPQAMEAGAAAVLSSKPLGSVPGLEVDDTLQALRQLAVAARKRSDAVRFGVTGSVGKTTVKESLADVLSHFGETHKSVKSYNNHWGVPLTLARMPQDTKYGVFEMGMNHAGELTDLTSLVRPDVAMVTTVSLAHAEFFDSKADIARAKAEIFSGLVENGTAIIPRDLDVAAVLRAELSGMIARTITFGMSEKSDIRLMSYDFDGRGGEGDMRIDGHTHHFSLRRPGAHAAHNAMAVVAACYAIDLPVADVLSVLSRQKAPEGRGQTFQFHHKGGQALIIDESYNANPASMRAALSILGVTDPMGEGRRIALLGDMLELGAKEKELHAGLAQNVVDAGADIFISCGYRMNALFDALPKDMEKLDCQGADQAQDVLLNVLKPGDVVLVKGSHGSGVHKIITHLKKLNQGEGA